MNLKQTNRKRSLFLAMSWARFTYVCFPFFAVLLLQLWD